MSSEKTVIDLNEIFPAKAAVHVVQEKLLKWDISSFQDKAVQLKGCSPTWAHLMVAGKLFGTVSSIEFLLDDSKGGIPILIYSRQ